MSTINSKLGFKFNHKPSFQPSHKLNNKPNHKFNLTIATLLALVLSTVMGTFGGVSALASTGSFVDVDSGTAYQEEITDLAKEGIIHGYGDGNYGPNNSLTRGELAKIIKNTLWGKAYSNLKCTDFPDVDTNNTFYLEITTLKCEGIVNGYPDGTFRPNAKVSIGEAIKFTFNNNKYTPASKPLSNYNQSKLFKKNLARDTFGTFIDKAVQNGALDQDYDGGLLDISQYIDRKQMANLIHRARKPNQEKIKIVNKTPIKTLTLPEYPDFSMEYPREWSVETRINRSLYPKIDRKIILLKKENSEFEIVITPLFPTGCGDLTEFTRNSFSSQNYIYLNTTDAEYNKEIIAEGKVEYIFGRKDNQNFNHDCFLSNDTIYSNIFSNEFKQTFKKDKVESLVGFYLTFDPKDQHILDEVGQMLDSVEGIVDQEEQDESSLQAQDQKILLELEKELGVQIPRASEVEDNVYTLDSQGRVNKLSLNGFKVQTKHLQLISNLTSLEWLDLDSNQITKIEGLDSLTGLRELRFRNNQITKIEGLDNLTNLQDLSLDHNQITKIEGLDKLTGLQRVILDHNQITKIEGLDKLTNLQNLSLYTNQITKIEGLDKLTDLQELYLWDNQITKIEGLDKLTSLEWLALSSNKITKIEELDKLTSLKELWLWDNQITDATPLEALLLNQKKAGKPILDISYSLEDNPLQTPPMEVMDKGSEAFLEWVEENR